MRSCHSFYGTGRTIPESDRVFWQLSVLLAKQFYSPTSFYGDEPSYNRLKSWGVEFDEVNTSLIPEETAHAHPMCWSAGKLVAMRDMARKGEPFFHIDGDAFTFNRLPEAITSSAMFCQCIETKIRRRPARYRKNTHYPINELLPHLHMPNWMTKFSRLDSQPVINMGIFGGTDLGSIIEYCDIAIKTFVNDRHNNQCLKRLDRAMPHFLGIACIAEQWSLAAYCNWKRITPTPVMERVDSFNVNRMHEVHGYAHIYTALRRLPAWRKWAKHRLRLLLESEPQQEMAA